MPKLTEHYERDLKVLVIDDQRSILKVIKELLASYGCHAVTVDSAEEAEQLIQWGQVFSLIITDLKMPWLNGVDFCKRVKALHPQIKIYALSGNIDCFDRKELDDSGFDGIFQKPVSSRVLKKILSHSVGL